jgi:uncharacterized coiled-coil protein SlyX
VYRELTVEEARKDPERRAYFLTAIDVQDAMLRKATGDETAFVTSCCVEDITAEFMQLQLQESEDRIAQLEATIQQQAATIQQLEAIIQELQVQVQRIPQLEAKMRELAVRDFIQS